MNVEQKLESIRSKWAVKNYRVGEQSSKNFIHQSGALKMIDIMETFDVPLDGLETYEMVPAGHRPNMKLSIEFFPGVVPAGQSYYSYTRAHIKKIANPDVYYYQVYYDKTIAEQMTYRTDVSTVDL